jgi:NAD(P)-dependent dehydrogenase (short-subunit alcohol dehydrogenase family)
MTESATDIGQSFREEEPMRSELLKGKVAIVTGAGSGIGRASVLALVSHGAEVVGSDMDEAAVAETARLANEIRRDAARHVTGNVTRIEDMQALVTKAVNEFGHLDVVHANAGISQTEAMAGEIPLSQWQQVLDVNVTGVFLTFKASVPELLKSAGASFIVTASGAGLIGVPSYAAYVASKHAVIGFTKAAALDYAAKGIRINAIAPGTTNTAMFSTTGEAARAVMAASTPIRRLAEAEEIANVAVWLASDLSSYVVGATVVSDGGHSIV